MRSILSWSRSFPQSPDPRGLLALWLTTATLGALATTVQWSYYSSDLHLHNLPPFDKLVFIWELLAVTLVAFLPLLLASHLLMMRGRRRSAWILFIVGQLLACAFFIGDLRIYRITGRHLNTYVQFLFDPQLMVIGGGSSVIVQSVFRLFCLAGLLVLLSVLGGGVITRFLHRFGQLPHPKRLLPLAPTAYAMAILGVVILQNHVQSYGRLHEFVSCLPFDLSHLGFTVPPPSSGPFVNELNDQLQLKLVHFAKIAENPPPLDGAARITREDPPNVIVLVVDSLRRDMFDPRYMPRLYAHAQQGMVFAEHNPAVNGTHMGMFAITYGRYSMFYDRILDRGIKPQLPAVFNQSGYHTTYLEGHDDSNFYRMWEYVGPGSGFNDTTLRIHGDQWDAADRDILHYIPQLLSTRRQPQFILALLSSVHFPYFHPAEFTKHQPTIDPRKKTIVDMNPDTDRAPLFNRYKNAVGYMDHLLGEFLDQIDLNRNLVLIVGDHGESFWEDGHLGHAGPMSQIVMQTPCVWIGAGVPQRQVHTITQHVDLLPTLLHLVQGEPVPVRHIQGRNILTENKPRISRFACPPFTDDKGITFMIRDPRRNLEFYWSDEHQRLFYRGEVNEKGRADPYIVPPLSAASFWARRIGPLLKECSQ